MSKSDRQDIHNSDIPLVCRACEARHGGICGALRPDQLSTLSKYTKKSAHGRDVSISDNVAGADTYSNILSGVVKLTKLMPDGRQQIVGLQFAPDFLGNRGQASSDIVAETATNVRLCSFPKSVLEELINETPKMEQLLHEQHTRELDEARDWMLTLGRKTAIEKVASFLLLVVTHIDPDREESHEALKIELPLKRADIADFLGLTIETVSRQITNLRKKGVIDIVDRNHILIADVAKLGNIANSN